MEYTELDDRDVVAHALEGRDSAFRELLSRYERPVFSLVIRMVRDPTLAEDLAQEAFIKAFNALDSYDPSYRFSNWVFKIANNLAIDHLRRKRLDTVSLDTAPGGEENGESEGLRMQIADSGESPQDYTESRELGGQIEQAIGRLRPEYRTAILLRHVEGHAYDEIADIMELPLGTVKTYIHRGRSELKDLLEGVTA